MWIYKKMLQHPVTVSGKDLRMAKNVLTQYGGPDGELGASLRYLTQRFYMPLKEGTATLTDIGSEELGHLEMIGTIFSKLVEGATKDELINSGLGGYNIEHGCNPFYVNVDGVPWTASYIGSKGDPEVDMYENMAAEQKARSTYDYLINLTDDEDVLKPLRFLREREVVHFQRFGEALNYVRDKYNSKDFVSFDPQHDNTTGCIFRK